MDPSWENTKKNPRSQVKLQVPRLLWQAHFANEHGIQAIHKDYHKGHLEPWYPGSKKRGDFLTKKMLGA